MWISCVLSVSLSSSFPLFFGLPTEVILPALLFPVKSPVASAVYFNSTNKTVIGSKDSLDRSFQGIFNRINNWISEGSGWMIESVDVEYVNVSIYSPLSGSLYVESIA